MVVLVVAGGGVGRENTPLSCIVFCFFVLGTGCFPYTNSIVDKFCIIIDGVFKRNKIDHSIGFQITPKVVADSCMF